MKTKLLFFIVALLGLFSCSKQDQVPNMGYDETYRMIRPYFDDRNIDRMLTLIDSMEQAHRLDTTHADFLRGISYDACWNMRLAEHYYSKAFYSYKKPISDWSNYAEAGYRLSVILMTRNNYQQSFNLASRLLAESENEPRFPAVYRIYLYTNVGDCQMKLHLYDDARQNYLKAYDEIMEKDGQKGVGISNADAMIMSSSVCRAFMEMGDDAEVDAWLQRFSKHLEEYTVEGDQKLVREYQTRRALFRARIFYGQGKKAQAIAIFDSIPKSQIDNPANILEAGSFLMSVNRYREAARFYAMYDSVFNVRGDRTANFSIITDEMVPRFRANYYSGNSSEAMSLAVDICQAIDSAVAHYYQDDLSELAVIYKLHEQEKNEEQERLHKEMWRLAAITMLLLFIVVCSGLVVYARQNRKLQKKSYDLSESKRKLKHIEPETSETPPADASKFTATDSRADFRQNLYFRLCDMLEKEKNFTDSNLTREDLASMLGTNYKYVCDAIRECTSGMSVTEFLNMKRLEYATELLLTSDMAVSEIADLCGFNSRSYFNRLFRSRYGVTPVEYRKNPKNTPPASIINPESQGIDKT